MGCGAQEDAAREAGRPLLDGIQEGSLRTNEFYVIHAHIPQPREKPYTFCHIGNIMDPRKKFRDKNMARCMVSLAPVQNKDVRPGPVWKQAVLAPIRGAWLQTNGVNTNGAAAKVMSFDRLEKKVRPGTFGKIKVG